MESKPVLETTPLVSDGQPSKVEGLNFGASSARLTSDESIADRPVRNHFNHIIFILLGVMALATVLGIVFMKVVQPRMGGDTRGRQSTPASSAHPQ